MAPGSPHHSREMLGGMAQLLCPHLGTSLGTGFCSYAKPILPPAGLHLPMDNKTQHRARAIKSKVKLYFTVIFSIYKELQYMFMGTPSTGLPFSTRSFTYS